MRKWLGNLHEAKPSAILPFLSVIIPKLHSKACNCLSYDTRRIVAKK